MMTDSSSVDNQRPRRSPSSRADSDSPTPMQVDESVPTAVESSVTTSSNGAGAAVQSDGNQWQTETFKWCLDAADGGLKTTTDGIAGLPQSVQPLADVDKHLLRCRWYICVLIEYCILDSVNYFYLDKSKHCQQRIFAANVSSHCWVKSKHRRVIYLAM
jgi:hypothetical protein